LPSGATLEVYNALGQVVRPAATTLEVAGLPAGVYLVRVTTAVGVATQRLVRQ